MKIKNKIFLSFSTAASILMTIIGFILYFELRGSIENEVKLSAFAIADARSEAISRYIEGITREMKTEAERNLMKTMDMKKIAEDLSKQLKSRNDTYDHFFVADLKGNYISSNGKSGSIADREYFKELISTNKDFVISNPLISKSTGNPVFILAYVIRDNSGKQIGVLGNNIGLKTITKISQDAKIGLSGHGWICDNKGLIFAHPDETVRMNLNLNEAEKSNIFIKKENVESILKQDSGIVHYYAEKKSNKMLLIYHKISNTPGWTFSVSVPEKEIFATLNKITLILILLVFAVIISMAVISIIISNNITKPITQFTDKFRLLSEGDLTVRTDIKTGDELEYLSNNFNLFTEKLEDVISNIKDGATLITESSDEINKANENLAQKASMQASSLEETSSTMEEISSIISGNTIKTEEADKMMLYTAKKSEEIEDLSQKLNLSIKDISNSSKKIENIIDVIDEIAFQTNLLALNAAVEAARAGEQGRGFAVVAVEVRNLAARSGKAAKEIKDLIKESVDKVEQGSNFVDKTINSIQEIVSEVRKGSIVIADIAASAKEQMTGVDQVNKAIANLDEVTQTNAGIAEETSASTNILYEKAHDFLNLVNFFKIKNNFTTHLKQKLKSKENKVEKIIPFDDDMEEI